MANYTIDACLASLMLAISLTYFLISLLSPAVTYRATATLDDAQLILARALKEHDILWAVMLKDKELIRACIYSCMNPSHTFYMKVIMQGSELELGEEAIKERISVNLPGWNGTLSPITIIFAIEIGG